MPNVVKKVHCWPLVSSPAALMGVVSALCVSAVNLVNDLVANTWSQIVALAQLRYPDILLHQDIHENQIINIGQAHENNLFFQSAYLLNDICTKYV